MLIKLIKKWKKPKDRSLPLPENRVISEPGHYRVVNDIDLKDEPFGIRIEASSVFLDFRGNRLIANDTQRNENFGIHVANAENVRVANGYVEGFYYGLIANNCKRLLVDRMHFHSIKYAGIHVAGEKIYLADNLITDLDFSYPKNEVDYYVIGISIASNDSHVIKNKIKNVMIPDKSINSKVEYVGMLISGNTKSCVVLGNHLHNNPSNRPNTYAVWLGKNASAYIANNQLKNHYHDFAISSSENVGVRDNVIANADTVTTEALEKELKILKAIKDELSFR